MQTRFFTIIAFCFTLIFIISTPALAQDIAETLKNRTPEQRAVGLTQIMKAKLKLDSLQTKKVQEINIKYAAKTDVVMKSDAGKFAKFKQLKDIGKEKDDELKGVMDAGQFKEYQLLEQQIKDKVKENMKNRNQ